MSLDPTLAQAAASHLVPASFAEKAMASLMQLHEDLCAEKEKRVELYRQLMEKEQALAELAMYVRILEERLEGGVNPASAQSAPFGASARVSADPAGATAAGHSATVARDAQAARAASGDSAAMNASSPLASDSSGAHSPAGSSAGTSDATSTSADSASRARSAQAPKPPQVASGPARASAPRRAANDWKVW